MGNILTTTHINAEDVLSLAELVAVPLNVQIAILLDMLPWRTQSNQCEPKCDEYSCSTPNTACTQSNGAGSTDTCGDEVVTGSEICDDGDMVSSDVYSDACGIENGYSYTD